MRRHILVVEDDDHLADGLQINLKLEGHETTLARSAEEALRYWERGDIDLILLDVTLPDMDGFEFCRRIREAGDHVPVLFLTARDRNEDRIRGLEEGGDDYITKPFDLGELLARIKGIFRRQEWYREESAPKVLEIGECRVDLQTFEVETPAGRVVLKEKEAMILRLLAERRGHPVDRFTILDRVWGYDATPTTRTVDNFIVRLRKVLESDPANPQRILTVRGAGYRLVL